MPHVATLVGGDTAIPGFPFYLSCSCGVQGRFSNALDGSRYCGVHFAGQNQNDILQFTDNSGNGLLIGDNSPIDVGLLPQMTSGIQY
jgi:hypothetical protein